MAGYFLFFAKSRDMNWLQKLAKEFPITKWQIYTQKAIESFVPGEWKQYGAQASNWGDINWASYIGKNILSKPNSMFYIAIEMKRDSSLPRVMNSEYGNKGVVFQCRIKASSHQKWPTLGQLIGNNDMLDTPYEIAKFVEETIQDYNPDSYEDDDGDNPNFDPITPTPQLVGA